MLSISSKKVKLVATVLVLVILAGVCTAVSRVQLKKINIQSVESKSNSINFKVENNQERLNFISQFGWEVDKLSHFGGKTVVKGIEIPAVIVGQTQLIFKVIVRPLAGS